MAAHGNPWISLGSVGDLFGAQFGLSLGSVGVQFGRSLESAWCELGGRFGVSFESVWCQGAVGLRAVGARFVSI